jgi:hypothetical protein
MRNYNKRQQNGRSLHPCDHSVTDRREPKESGNVERYKDVTHAPDGCNALRLGRPVEPGEAVTCNKCLLILGSQ